MYLTTYIIQAKMKNRAESEETKLEIKYIPGNIESMREALNDYKKLIDCEEAFEDSYCIAHFVCEEQGIISDEDYEQCYSGEELFFKYAVEIGELKEDLKSACESMVTYSRRLNDSAEMWLTDEMPFGIQPLYHFASKYPEYGYLLASFLVPYWDDEHMPEALFMLGAWSDKLGVTKDTLKAYCYCDNSRAREIMLGYDTYDCVESPEKIFAPITYFRESPENYEVLKMLFVERFKEIPYLQYTDDIRYYNANPVKNFVLDMLYQEYPYDSYDDDFDRELWITNTFVNHPAEEEISELKNYIEEKLGRSIVPDKEEYFKNLKATKQREEQAKDLAKAAETTKWQELFLNIYPKGNEIWDYVIAGKNKEILEEVPVIDIIKVGVDKDCELAEEFEDTCWDSLIDGIDKFIGRFARERKTEYSMSIFAEDNEVLRLYDVLHKSMNEIALPNNLIEVLSQVNRSVDISKRYNTNKKQAIHYHLMSLRKIRKYGTDSVEESLTYIYEVIQEDRREAREWIRDEFNSEEDRESFRTSWRVACTLLGTYIVLKDEENNIEDDLSIFVKEYTEKNSVELIYDFLRNDGKWPTRYLEEDIKKPDRYYSKEYIETVEKNSKLWSPMETYLGSGKFKDYSYKESFEPALAYLKSNLLVDEEDKINTNQESYKCFTFEEEFVFEIIIAYLSQKIYSLEDKDVMNRFFRLVINIAPLKVITALKAIVPQLKEPLKLESYISVLDELKELGLSNEAYWIIQLKQLHKNIDSEDIDLEALVFSKNNSHYVRLLNLYSNNLVFDRHLQDAWLLVSKNLIEIKEALTSGLLLIEEKYEAEFLKAAMTIFGVTPQSQRKMNEVAIEAFKKELYEKIKRPVYYYKDYLKLNSLEYTEDRMTYDDCTVEDLESLGAKYISDEEYSELKSSLEECESGWIQEIIVKAGPVKKTLYNTNILSFIAESKRRGEACYVSCIDIILVEEKCSGVHEKAITRYDNQNFKDLVMEDINAYLKYQKDFESIRMLVSTCFTSYESLGRRKYDAVDLADMFCDLNEGVQQQILSIVSCISPEELGRKLRYNDENKYLNILIEKQINSKEIFNYLVDNNNRTLLRKMLSTTNCSQFIRKAKVDAIVVALANVGGLAIYYPLVFELREHKSLKVRQIAQKLIEVCGITEDVLTPYKIVDYGIYVMEKEVVVTEKEGVTREAIEPKCVETVETLKAELGMYIGFRFTATNSELVPKVFEHKVVVTHPIQYGNETKEHKTKWNQNGYSNSNIFLGWFFDDEIVPGMYTFEVYDMLDNLMLKKIFYIE